jgi:hypothetical protein
MSTIISIQSDENYYNTELQIAKRNEVEFVDNSSPSFSGSIVVGLFQQKSTYDNWVVQNSSLHATSSTVIDSAGNSRKILSPDIDYFSSSSLDSYKNGVEITQDKHWIAGLAKITAGTPGHLYDKSHFGINDLDIISSDKYVEIDVFDPVTFIEKSDISQFIYPIVTSDANQLENYILNGIIEPFPIRPIISNFSINFPFEPHSTRGQFGIGNTNWRGATDVVTSIDVFEPSRNNLNFFLDEGDIRKISTGSESSGSFPVGPPDGYFNMDENIISSFEDVVYPRDEKPGDSYDSDMLQVVSRMTGSSIDGESYVKRKEKSATNGFVCEYSSKGVDSVAFKNLTWNKDNRDNRRYRQDVLSLRDAEPFIKTSTSFSDNSTMIFGDGDNKMTVEYPTMLPLEMTASLGLNDVVRSELFRTGSIRVVRSIAPDVYDNPLLDSTLGTKRRLGTL